MAYGQLGKMVLGTFLFYVKKYFTINASYIGCRHIRNMYVKRLMLMEQLLILNMPRKLKQLLKANKIQTQLMSLAN